MVQRYSWLRGAIDRHSREALVDDYDGDTPPLADGPDFLA